MRLLRFLVLAVVFLIAAGCESKPAIESSKDSAYQQKLTRVLVATDLAVQQALAISTTTPTRLQKALSDKLSTYGVAVSSVGLEGPNGGSRALASAVSRDRLQQILEITATSVSKQGAVVVAASFDCSLYDATLNRRVWRSEIVARGGLLTSCSKPPQPQTVVPVGAPPRRLRQFLIPVSGNYSKTLIGRRFVDQILAKLQEEGYV